MALLKSLITAFACFSRIPMPKTSWEDDDMRYLMACFPMVGLAVGALVFFWCEFCLAIGFGSMLRAVGIALIPVVVSGGIHMDGFADVIDALASHADPVRKRAILKDPHVGAFAVIGVVSYLLAYAGLASEAPFTWRTEAMLTCVYVIVRCESAFATLAFKGASSGMLSTFKSTADSRCRIAIVLEFAFAAVALAVVAPIPAAVMLVVGIVLLVLLRPFAYREFGGMSGDVAGFFLQSCELAMVACLIIFAKVVGM